MTKDYYKILGVAEFESAENIKIAYRKLARKYHPDIAGESESAILKFKEINEAYQVLSNKTKKEEYDRIRQFYSYAKQNTNTFSDNNANKSNVTNPQKKKNFEFNWEIFLSKKHFNESFHKEQRPTPKKGEDVYSDIEITLFEALSGVTKVINVLQTTTCPICKGRKFINNSVCSHCKGKGEISNYKKFSVKIPAKVKDLSKIRLSGEGEKGVNGGLNGDLYLNIHVKDKQEFKTEGLNVVKTVVITPFEAVLGASINLSTHKGNITLNIPPKTQSGQKIRIAGFGMVQNEKVGDMIVIIEINIQSNLTEQELDLYKKLRDLSGGNIQNNKYDKQS